MLACGIGTSRNKCNTNKIHTCARRLVPLAPLFATQQESVIPPALITDIPISMSLWERLCISSQQPFCQLSCHRVQNTLYHIMLQLQDVASRVDRFPGETISPPGSSSFDHITVSQQMRLLVITFFHRRVTFFAAYSLIVTFIEVLGRLLLDVIILLTVLRGERD